MPLRCPHPLHAATLVAQQIGSGNLRALGVASATRTPQLDSVPTFAEGGVSGVEADAWSALFAPAKTPPAIINLLQQEIARGINKPEVRELFMNAGVEVVASTAEEFTATIKSEMTRLGKVIKDAGIRE